MNKSIVTLFALGVIVVMLSGCSQQVQVPVIPVEDFFRNPQQGSAMDWIAKGWILGLSRIPPWNCAMDSIAKGSNLCRRIGSIGGAVEFMAKEWIFRRRAG